MQKQNSRFYSHLPHRHALSLALPMIIANISVPLMGLADTAMLGQLDNAVFMGAVAVGANIFALLFWMLAFLRMSVTAHVGKSYGANQLEEGTQIAFHSALLAIIIAFVLMITHPFYLPIAVSWVSQDPSVHLYATQYCSIRIFAAPAVLLTYVLIGWLMGVQSMKAILVVTVCNNVCNIVLDYFFILQFHWDVKGAAWASVISDYLGLLLAIILCAKAMSKQIAIRHSLSRLLFSGFKTINIAPLLQSNTNLFIRTALLLLVFNFFTAQGGVFGNDTLAANAILIQLMFIGTFAIDGYAYAAETMVANATGKAKQSLIHKVVLATFAVGIAISFFCALGFWAIKPFVISLMTSIDSVRTELDIYYIWLCIMPLAAAGCYLFDGVFIGAGKTQTLRNWMAFCVFIIFIPSWWLFKGWGNHGLWLAFVLFHITRGVTLGWMYHQFSQKNLWFKQ